MSTKEEKTSKTAEEPAVVVVEPDEEPFTFEPTEHPLLDVDYQHAPETAGLDYAGELVDEAEPKGKKGSKKDVADEK